MESTRDFGAPKDFKQRKVLMLLDLKDLRKEMSMKPRKVDCMILARATERTTEWLIK